MAGKGPVRKPEGTRARGNKDTVPLTLIERNGDLDQPELPHFVDWHPRTLVWWEMWATSPLTDNFIENDWNYLIDTALVHSAYWNGQLALAGELRLRAQKFGETPEDRARLRIQIVDANIAEDKEAARTAAPASRSKYTAPKAAS